MTVRVILHPEREKSLVRKHPWVFASAIDKVTGKVKLGDTVDVHSSTGDWLGRGAWSPKSQIQIRIWTFEANESIDHGFFQRRIQCAQLGRERLIKVQGLTGYRLIAGESDGLPGVTIDRYDNTFVCQLLSAGADKHRDKIVWALQKQFPNCNILERSDVEVRKKEGLEPVVQVLSGDIPDEIIIQENGVNIIVNPTQGHKTGFYLDQRDNRQIAARYSEGQNVLNCFCYTGTFGSYALNGGANHVTNIDVSDSALAIAKRNVEINQLNLAQCDFINKDVFQALREYRDDEQTFDTIILDPPKFVESKHHLNRACRGYKDINMLAMQIIKNNGTLLTFSCSGLMPMDLFQKVVADAALDAGKQVQFIERLCQASDHPIASNYPESYYLKGLVCRVYEQ